MSDIKKGGKTLFDHLNAILKFQSPAYFKELSDQDKKTWSTYMLNRYLSMNPEWAPTVNEIQHLTVGMQLSSEMVYQLFIYVFPQSSIFLKYIKSKEKTKFDKDLIRLLMEHFNVSEREVLDYLDIMDSSEIERIVRMYGFEEKEIRKLLKTK